MGVRLKIFVLVLLSHHHSTSSTWDIFQQIPKRIPDRIPPLVPVRELFRPEQEHSSIPVYRPPQRDITRSQQNSNPISQSSLDPNYFSNVQDSERGSRKKLIYPTSESDNIPAVRSSVPTPLDVFTRPQYSLVSPTSVVSVRPRIPVTSSNILQKLAESVNDLSLALHRKFANEQGNIVFSPLSISTALGILYYGSRGITAEEMKKVLKYDTVNLLDNEVHQGFRILMNFLTSSNENILEMANVFLAQKGSDVRPQYVSGLRYYYQAEVREVDFVTEATETSKQINEWVSKKTNNKIDKLVDNLDPATVLVILNAVYFKGMWQTKFNPLETRPFPFYGFGFLSPSSVIPMMMMNDKAYKFTVMEKEGVKVLELPYKGKDIAMWIVLPVDKDTVPVTVDSLASLERRLSTDLLKKIDQSLVNTTLEMVVIPKFRLEYSKELSQMLSSMGMRSAFRDANLSGISDNSLFVSDVIHKATIEINEEGSEASAATAVTINRTGPNPLRSFIANYPFLFFIMDKINNMILFTGKVTDL